MSALTNLTGSVSTVIGIWESGSTGMCGRTVVMMMYNQLYSQSVAFTIFGQPDHMNLEELKLQDEKSFFINEATHKAFLQGLGESPHMHEIVQDFNVIPSCVSLLLYSNIGTHNGVHPQSNLL